MSEPKTPATKLSAAARSAQFGAAEEDATTTSIQISGDLRKLTMGRISAPITHDGSELQVELPVVSVRSIRSSGRVEFGKLTVVGVVDGFEDGQCFVIAAAVHKLGG